MFPEETWQNEKSSPGWVVLGAEKDQTASCPLNRAINWVKLTLGDATVAVCKMAACTAPRPAIRLGSGCLERPGLSSLGSGRGLVVTLASAPPLRPRQSGGLAMSAVVTREASSYQDMASLNP